MVSLGSTCLSIEPDGRRRHEVELQVLDDGAGFELDRIPPDRLGLGLGIIRERAQSIGARLRIESQPEQGTRLVVNWKEEG
jgi:signal transduction histidine kinase